ncbi:MAG: dienelactone hydrolase family protein [Cyclobacteriaceae bacterium]|nr:dienelactone hydrolase family protein [Cyclobacteriaceae bacterium]
MPSHSFQVPISSTLGNVSAELEETPKQKALLILSHGAGAGMHHTFMKQLAVELAAQEIATLRFNFPYIEKGRRMPHSQTSDMETIEGMIHTGHQVFPDLPLFVGGKSYGGRMTSQVMASAQSSFARGVIFFGFPLHPAGKPSMKRADHLKEVKLPMLFLQGTNDALADITLLENVCASLPFATLRKFKGSDHAFAKVPVRDLASETRQWMEPLLLL